MRRDDPNWRHVKGYEGLYMISNCGIVMRQDANGEWVEKKSSTSSNGYKQVSLFKDGKSKTIAVHLLVLSHFDEDLRGGGVVCNHKNGIKTDNRIENLEWVTPKQNTHHAISTGLYRYDFKGDDHYNSKLTSDKVLKIRKEYECGNVTMTDLAKKNGVALPTICDIIKRRTWVHI